MVNQCHSPNRKESVTAVVRQGTNSPDCSQRRRFLMTNGQLIKHSHMQKQKMMISQSLEQCQQINQDKVLKRRIHCSFAWGVALKDLILLDSDPTDTIFCNPKYVKNIRQAKSTLESGTNGGPLVSNQICNILDLGKAWFNKDSIANIISIAHMTSKYMPNEIVQFRQMSNRLYAMNQLSNDS